MRTYLVDNESNEVIFDLTRTVVRNADLAEFDFHVVEDNEAKNQQKVFVRRLGTSLFVSIDGKKWEKTAKQDLPREMLNVDTVYKVYRGYKPSGLGGAAAGELLTQMPGKIVKVLVKEGDTVKQGQPLLILEAMKMENEIKSNMDGVVKAIHVKVGQSLESGVLMMEVEES